MFDIVAHLYRQRKASRILFGPGQRTAGVLDHIRKEIAEIEAKADDVEEWVDLITLAFDGALRRGFTPEQIVTSLNAKQTKNELRDWPDWTTADPSKAIEHVRVESSRLDCSSGCRQPGNCQLGAIGNGCRI